MRMQNTQSAHACAHLHWSCSILHLRRMMPAHTADSADVRRYWALSAKQHLRRDAQ